MLWRSQRGLTCLKRFPFDLLPWKDLHLADLQVHLLVLAPQFDLDETSSHFASSKSPVIASCSGRDSVFACPRRSNLSSPSCLVFRQPLYFSVSMGFKEFLDFRAPLYDLFLECFVLASSFWTRWDLEMEALGLWLIIEAEACPMEEPFCCVFPGC